MVGSNRYTSSRGAHAAWRLSGAGAALVLLLALVWTALAGGPPRAGAQSGANIVGDAVADGPVRAIAAGPQGTYLGGNFERVGKRTGASALLDSGNADTVQNWPDFAGGTVLTAIPDGADGFYVAGTFTSVDGESRDPLVRIRSNGDLDPNFKPDFECEDDCADLAVRALALSKVGDPDSASPSDDPACTQSCLYIGGEFSGISAPGIGTRSRMNLAAIDPETSMVADWQPRAEHSSSSENGPVHALAVHEVDIEVTEGEEESPTIPLVVAGGDFNRLPDSSTTRNGLGVVWGFGAVDGDGSKRPGTDAINWNPNPGSDIRALALGTPETDESDGEQSVAVYAGGVNPTGTNQTLRAFRLQVNTAGDNSGDVASVSTFTQWVPSPQDGSGDRKAVRALVVDDGEVAADDIVYAAGEFTHIGKQSEKPHLPGVAAIRPVHDPAGNATEDGNAFEDWRPAARGAVHALALAGDALYAGGDFERLGGEEPDEGDDDPREGLQWDAEQIGGGVVDFNAVDAREEGDSELVIAVGYTEESDEAAIFRRTGGIWVHDTLDGVSEPTALSAVAIDGETAWAVGKKEVVEEDDEGQPVEVDVALALRLDAGSFNDQDPVEWEEVATDIDAPLDAVALAGDDGFLGDAEGAVHPVSGVTGTPSVGSPVVTLPLASQIAGIALASDGSEGFAVGSGDMAGEQALLGEGRFYPLSVGDDASIAEFPELAELQTPGGLRSVALGGSTAIAVDQNAAWERTADDTWAQTSTFGTADALNAVSVDETGGEAAVVGRIGNGPDAVGAAWVRSDSGDWEEESEVGGPLTGVKVLAVDEMWAVGSGGTVARFHELEETGDDGSEEEPPHEAGRFQLAKLDADAGTAGGDGAAREGWDPSPAGGGLSALAVADPDNSASSVLAGGNFTLLHSKPRKNLAAIDANGEVAPWSPGADATIHAMELSDSGNRLFVGGDFDEIGGADRSHLAALSTDPQGSGNAIPGFTQTPNNGVLALAVRGSTLYLGGGFTKIRPENDDQLDGSERIRLAAVDIETGELLPWSPSVTHHDGGATTVQAIDASCSTVYLGGGFTRVNGKERERIAEVNSSSGALSSWNPGADGVVRAIVRRGHVVYAGGKFGSIGTNNELRSRIAAINARTGEATGWNPSLHASGADVFAIRATDSVVYVGGSFSEVGQAERDNLAAISASSGAATGFAPDPNGRVFALAGRDNLLHAGGEFVDLGKRPQSRYAAFGVGPVPSSSDCSLPPVQADPEPEPEPPPPPPPPPEPEPGPPPPPPPPPTPEFLPDLKQGATRVSSFRDLSAWSAFRDGKWRLVLSQGETEWRAPVAGRDVPFDVNVGPGPDRSPLVAYSRCRQEPRVRRATQPLPAWATGRGCDAYVFNPASGNEFRIPGASTSTASEFLPSIWGDAVAFARVFESRDGYRGIVPYIYARRYTRDGRSVRIPGGARGGTGLPGPTSLDFYHHRVLFSWGWEQRSGGQAELRIGTPFRRTQMVFSAGYERSLAQLVTPHGARGRIFFGAQRYVDGSDGVRNQRAQFMRYRISTDQLDHSPAPRFLLSVAPEGDGVVFSVSGDPLASRGCVTNEGGCAVGRFPRLFFRR